MRITKRRLRVSLALAICAFAGPLAAQERNLYWGDTHVHTSNSIDAGAYRFMVGPEEAYRFARGEEVQSNEGTLVKLVRPLDFLQVSDHAEYLGLWNGLRLSMPSLTNYIKGIPKKLLSFWMITATATPIP